MFPPEIKLTFFRYDCSGKSKSEWYETGQKRLGWGIYYISSGLFFQLIGWPVIWVFITKFSMTNALKVYRIMVFIGLIEITEIWGNSVFPGFVAVFGEVYCTSPILMTIVGKMTMGMIKYKAYSRKFYFFSSMGTWFFVCCIFRVSPTL